MLENASKMLCSKIKGIKMSAVKYLAKLLFVIIFAFTTALTSCGTDPVSKDWKSIIPNGDKPGIGILLTETLGQVNSGFFYILDPNDLQTFSKERGYKLTGINQAGMVITCIAIVDDDSTPTKTRALDLTISIQSDLTDFQANQVDATLKSADGKLRSIVFKRPNEQ
jgi:hypothetical protein